MHIHLTMCKKMTAIEYNGLVLLVNTWSYFTVWKQMISGSFKNVIFKIYVNKLYSFNIFVFIGFAIY